MKTKARKQKQRKVEKAAQPVRPTTEVPENERPYGGMDLGNFKKNMGCGG